MTDGRARPREPADGDGVIMVKKELAMALGGERVRGEIDAATVDDGLLMVLCAPTYAS